MHPHQLKTFEYGWGTSNDPSENFWVRFNPAERETKSWKEEIYAAARKLAGSTEKHVILAFSGGFDSEVMCRAFFDQGLHFSVLTLEYAGQNEHDIVYAKRWCTERDVTQEIVRVDIKEFMKSGTDKYIEQKYITGKIFRYAQIKTLELIEERGGYGVLGGGEHLYVVDPGTHIPTIDDVYLDFEVGYAVPLEWCRRNKTLHQPYFYFSTPELCLSYFKIPLVDFALKNPEMFRSATNRFLFKRLNYKTEWPDLVPRPKYNGYEYVLKERDDADEILKERFGDLIQSCRLPVTVMLQQLSSK